MLDLATGTMTVAVQVPSLSLTETRMGSAGIKFIENIRPLTVSLVPATGYFYGFYGLGANVRHLYGVFLQGTGLNYGQGFLLDRAAIGTARVTP